MTTDRPRDARGRFLPTRDAAPGRALVVRDPAQDAGEPYMVSQDPDSRHLALSWMWLGGAIFVGHFLVGLPLAIDVIVILGAAFSTFFNLCIWCGKRWPKTTFIVLTILCGMMGSRRRRW
jgi:hypothetical protein